MPSIIRTRRVVPAGSVTELDDPAGTEADVAADEPVVVKVRATIWGVSMIFSPPFVLKRTVVAVPPAYLPFRTVPFLSSRTSARAAEALSRTAIKQAHLFNFISVPFFD